MRRILRSAWMMLALAVLTLGPAAWAQTNAPPVPPLRFRSTHRKSAAIILDYQPQAP